MQFDVFNGDADGICALLQLRLAAPLPSTLVTGVKRDIELLADLPVSAGDCLTVLDISLQKNISAVQQYLACGAEIFYVDHHQAPTLPQHSRFTALIDTSPTTCTSLLVNQYLQSKYALWAVTAAFGDNITTTALQLAQQLQLRAEEVAALKQLGTYLNYNSYGQCLADLHFSPQQVYQTLSDYASPLAFMAANTELYQQLQAAYADDMAQALALKPYQVQGNTVVILLPDQAWARRVSGVLGNALANAAPDKAHAILTPLADAAVQVSVRAPLNNLAHADVLCAQFTSGGGRKGAAGINYLPATDLVRFIQCFSATYH